MKIHPSLQTEAGRRAGLIAFVLVLALATPGCVAVVAGAGAGAAVAYHMGELESNESASLPALLKATETAFTQLGIAKVSERSDAFGAELIARTAMDKRIRVTFAVVTDQVTKTEIRVGTFGDREMSLKILTQIRGAL